VTGATPKLVNLLKTGLGAHAFRGAGDSRHVFVSNRVSNTISKIDYQTMTVLESYPAPSGPDCLDLSKDGQLIYVASRWAGKRSVIDRSTRQVVRQIKVGKSPHGVWTLDHALRH
jgi:YVTN family beta-propeller protein